MVEWIIFVQSFSNPVLDKFFILITRLGEENFIMLMTGLTLWCISKKLGYRLGFVYLTSTVVNFGLKEAFNVPRPIGMEGVKSLYTETALGSSFPSGHSQHTAAFWTTVMMDLKRKYLYVFGGVLIFLVGLSRVYLGLHTPLDVLGGITIGCLWAAVAYKLFDYAQKRRNYSIFLIIILLVLAGVFLKHDYFYKLVGTLIGFFAGFFIETSVIHFNEKCGMVENLVKIVIGFGFLIILKEGLKGVLPAVPFSDFFRYLSIGIWFTVGAPLIFRVLRLEGVKHGNSHTNFKR